MRSGQIRKAIASTLRRVRDVGVVHEYERSGLRSMDELIKRYSIEIGGCRKLRGWYIQRLEVSKERIGNKPSVEEEVFQSWRLTLYMALTDYKATEVEMDELLDKVIEEFDKDDTLGGTVDTCIIEGMAGLQVEQEGAAEFGGVLCNSAQLLLPTIYRREVI